MEQNEIITALHVQLKEAAQRIFTDLTIKPGNYTAADIDKILKLSESLHGFNTDQTRSEYLSKLSRVGIADEDITIQSGGFTATLASWSVFAKLSEWEKAFKIKPAFRALFARQPEANVIYSCAVKFPTGTKIIADHVAKNDPDRPMMNHIVLNPDGLLYASDMIILTQVTANISDAVGNSTPIYFEPKTLKALAGKRCMIRILETHEDYNGVIVTEDGKQFPCLQRDSWHYLEVNRVWPKVNRDGYFRIAKADIKPLMAFARNVTKSKEKTPRSKSIQKLPIVFAIQAGASAGTATFTDATGNCRVLEFRIEENPRVNVSFALDSIRLEQIAKIATGGVWYTEPRRPIVFDTIGTDCTILMPVSSSALAPFDACAGVVNALQRANYDDALKAIEEEERKEIAKSREIPFAEREQAAQRFCEGNELTFAALSDDGEILALTSLNSWKLYKGTFKKSDNLVLYYCNTFIVPTSEDITRLLTVCTTDNPTEETPTPEIATDVIPDAVPDVAPADPTTEEEPTEERPIPIPTESDPDPHSEERPTEERPLIAPSLLPDGTPAPTETPPKIAGNKSEPLRVRHVIIVNHIEPPEVARPQPWQISKIYIAGPPGIMLEVIPNKRLRNFNPLNIKNYVRTYFVDNPYLRDDNFRGAGKFYDGFNRDGNFSRRNVRLRNRNGVNRRLLRKATRKTTRAPPMSE